MPILRQKKDWVGGWVQKKAISADVQYFSALSTVFTYADIVGESEKVQKYADVI